MILQPDWITPAHVQAAKGEVLMKKGLPGLERARLARLDEGLCAQVLHIGSYDEEGPVLARLHKDWLPAHGLVENGHHHEIYLGDPRKTPPEKLRTLLRQPVRRAG
ncbi:MAG: GyrI-like domain-containing protein [Asticcacaulis sp.]